MVREEKAMGSLAATPVMVEPGRRSRVTLAVAWVGTLALSSLLEVVLVEAMGIDAPPMLWIWLVLAALLVGLAAIWEPARPLRGYFVVMLAVIAATYLLIPLLSDWTGAVTGSGIVGALENKTILFAVALGMAGFLVVALRQRPRDVFLTPGNLRAPTTLRLPGTRRPLTWGVLGTITTVLLFTGFATQMWLEGAFPEEWLQRLLPLAPLVVAAAALNAFGEEVIFRAGPLAFLHRTVGPNQAILMTSVWFGLAHYYGGTPPGPIGAIQSAALGLLLGKAMLATKGLGWPFIIHLAIDIVVFASIAVAAT
jgi:membrane protease YdiL (CAAX protease family)